MLEEKEIKDLKQYKKYRTKDLNTNSTLYYYNNILLKIPYLTKNNLDKLLNYIDELNLDCLVKPTSLIYQNKNLIGYEMINNFDYTSLKKNRRKDLDIKIIVAKKIIETSELLNNYNLIYNDYHSSNILMDNNLNLKICDLDAFTISEYDDRKLYQLRQVIIMALSYIYNIRQSELSLLLKSRISINKDNVVLDYLDNLSLLDNNSKILDELDYSNINCEKKVLRKLIKEEKERTIYYRL